MMDLSPHLVSGSCFLLCTPVCRPPAPSALVCSANLVTHTQLFHTRTQFFRAQHFFTDAHTHTQLFHTQLCHTHTQPFHTTLSLTSLSHMQLFHTPFCHVQLFLSHTHTQNCLTYTSITHTHTALFHTICLPPSPLSFLPFPSHFHACFVLVGRS